MGAANTQKRNSYMEKTFEVQEKNVRAASNTLAKGYDGGLIRQIRSRHRRSFLILSDIYVFEKFYGKMKDQFCLGMFKRDQSFERREINLQENEPEVLTN